MKPSIIITFHAFHCHTHAMWFPSCYYWCCICRTCFLFSCRGCPWSCIHRVISLAEFLTLFIYFQSKDIIIVCLWIAFSQSNDSKIEQSQFFSSRNLIKTSVKAILVSQSSKYTIYWPHRSQSVPIIHAKSLRLDEYGKFVEMMHIEIPQMCSNFLMQMMFIDTRTPHRSSRLSATCR